MFGTQYLLKLMLWWAKNRWMGGAMWFLVDGLAWKYMDSTFPDFRCEAQNVQLLLKTNGINPSSFRIFNWNTWHVIVIFKSLPTCFCPHSPLYTWADYTKDLEL